MPERQNTKAARHLNAMLAADEKLYERILDTPTFAYHFNELAKLALAAPAPEERDDA